ncbi:hypothetical protein BS78_10G099100 [Paspalum vaginatum]|nr:hypothetical protein BS78_10G099100 [Paspalum vaginatum]
MPRYAAASAVRRHPPTSPRLPVAVPAAPSPVAVPCLPSTHPYPSRSPCPPPLPRLSSRTCPAHRRPSCPRGGALPALPLCPPTPTCAAACRALLSTTPPNLGEHRRSSHPTPSPSCPCCPAVAWIWMVPGLEPTSAAPTCTAGEHTWPKHETAPSARLPPQLVRQPQPRA